MRTLAVTSGKGGVGKTNLSANLAIAFAERNLRVMVIDGDIGLANLDVILGVRSPLKLQHAITREKTLAEVIQDGPGGIKFIAGGSGIESLIRLDGPSGNQFLSELSDLECVTDVLVFDTGAGIDENVMNFLTVADEVLLIVTPDPASLADAYATAKALIMRKPMAVIKVILNMVDDETQAKAVHAKLTSVAQEFLGRPLSYVGSVRIDPKATKFIRKRQPFLLGDRDLSASKDVIQIAGALLGDPYKPAELSFADRLRGLLSFGRRAA